MASILVTGGAGFIGSHLVEALLRQGLDVVVLDSFDEFYPREIKERNLESLKGRPGFALVEGDIRDEALVEKVFTTRPIGSFPGQSVRANVSLMMMTGSLVESSAVVNARPARTGIFMAAR